MPLTATLVAVNIYKSRWNPRSTHSFHPRHQKKIHYKSPIPPILRFQTFNFANMKFIATTILIAATTTVAQYDPCRSPLFAVPLCCKTDVLGVLGLNCEARELLIHPHLQTCSIDPYANGILSFK